MCDNIDCVITMSSNFIIIVGHAWWCKLMDIVSGERFAIHMISFCKVNISTKENDSILLVFLNKTDQKIFATLPFELFINHKSLG